MSTIAEKAYYVRSKNAGPFWVTIDIFCDREENYHCFRDSENLTRETIAAVYGVNAELVKIFFLSHLKVIKISYPRVCPQGGMDERDMHAGQQYVQLLDLPL